MKFRGKKISLSGEKSLTLAEADFLKGFGPPVQIVGGICGVVKCSGGDSNPYGLLHQILSLARLPISPPERRVTRETAWEAALRDI